MIDEYVRHLENRDIFPDTDRPYTMYDVPDVWRDKVLERIMNDGYQVYYDGTVVPIEPLIEEEPIDG